jgi:AcrR family transcriptional regulator
MTPPKIPPENTRDAILEAAVKQFGEKGFEGVSVRDICEKINVNVSAIKYHFGGKIELYRECFKNFGQSKLDMASRLLCKASSLEELKFRLTIFSNDFIADGISDIQKTKMICREIEASNPMIDDIFEETFLKFYQTLVDMFSDAQKKKILAKNLDANLITSFMFHSITMGIRNDHINEKFFKKTLKDNKYRELFVNQLIEILFDGIKNKENL